MNEQILRFNIRAWGCKIKTNANAEAIIRDKNVTQGNDPKIKVHFEFDSADLPSDLEITLAQPIKNEDIAFTLKEPIKIKIEQAQFDLEIPLNYISGKPGDYRVEFNFRHAEYGTELAMIMPIIFKLQTPAVEIKYCRSKISRISKGSEVQIQVGLVFPAPQKIRGLIFGRLVSDGKLINKLYELEPKRISFQGEKEINWPVRIPYNETETGTLNAIIEFKSKESITKQEFKEVLDVRVGKLLLINSITSTHDHLSPGDDLEINIDITNKGLNQVELEIIPEIINSNEISLMEKTDKKLEPKLKWTLPNKKLNLKTDERTTLSYSWQIPQDMANGKYNIVLYYKYLDTGETEQKTQYIFEVHPHHDIKISNAILITEKLQPGSKGVFKVLISDSGTRASEPIDVQIQILDILAQEQFKKKISMGFSKGVNECEIVWPIPKNIEPNSYDLVITVSYNNTELQKRKFSKFLNIELPVKIELHLFLPKPPELVGWKVDNTISKCLLENEIVIKNTEYLDMGIFLLNSNTHIFTLDDKPILYTNDDKSSMKSLRMFIDNYYSYLITKEFINSNFLEEEIKYWSQLGYCWINLVLLDKNLRKGPGIRELKISSIQKLNLSAWAPVAKGFFKNTVVQKQIRKIKLENIFKENIVNDKNLLSNDDFRFIFTILRLLIEDELKFQYSLKNLSIQKTVPKTGKIGLKVLEWLIGLNRLLKFAIKFKTKANSEKLEKKFNQILNSLISFMKPGQVKREPDDKLFEALASGFHYLLLYLVTEIEYLFIKLEKERVFKPSYYNRLLMLQIIYHLVLLSFQSVRWRLDNNITQAELKELVNETARVIDDLRRGVSKYWIQHSRWQKKYINYLKNSEKRAELLFMHRHVKVTTNPVIIESMRGGQGNGKVIIGNNGSKSVNLDALLALPSIHWSIIEPEAINQNNVYILNRINIPSKQTKETTIKLSFPNSLSFQNYKAILKLNPKPFKLLPEI